MIKKMRLRIILLSMAAFLAVMVVIVAAINITNYISVTGETDRLLDQLRESELSGGGINQTGEIPFLDFSEDQPQDMMFMVRFFVVRYDSDGNPDPASANYFSLPGSSEDAACAESAYHRTASRGNIGKYRYLKENTGDSVMIIFLDTEKEQDFSHSLLLMSLLVALGSFILVSLLVILLSKKVVSPFARNIEQQKQFITDASHELKTPLTSISTSLDVLDMEHGEDEWTANIRTQTDRMIQMVGELVTLTRLDEASLNPVKEPVQLSDLIWETIEGFQPRAKAEGKEISTDIADGVIVTGDPDSIRKMLTVLLDNAVRYSDENGKISISLKKRSGHAELTVYNTCSFDVPPDTTRLLERFYRPDESRSKDTGGTGIGLAIAKAAAEANGGTISAECPDGKFMTIKVVF